MKRSMLVLTIAAACGHKAPAPVHEAPSGLSPGTQPMAWLVGDWASDDGAIEESWLAAAGALYGVRFANGDYVAYIVDDAGEAKALVAWTYANGAATGPTPVADDPKSTGDATMTHGGVALHRATASPLPAAEDADRQFEKDTHARGPDGWADWFGPDGVNWGGGQIIKGREAIKADIASLLGRADLTWRPVGSRGAASGHLGFTVGTFAVIKEKRVIAKGSYQTVWRKQPDGTWKITADGGRPEN